MPRRARFANTASVPSAKAVAIMEAVFFPSADCEVARGVVRRKFDIDAADVLTVHLVSVHKNAGQPVDEFATYARRYIRRDELELHVWCLAVDDQARLGRKALRIDVGEVHVRP